MPVFQAPTVQRRETALTSAYHGREHPVPPAEAAGRAAWIRGATAAGRWSRDVFRRVQSSIGWSGRAEPDAGSEQMPGEARTQGMLSRMGWTGIGSGRVVMPKRAQPASHARQGTETHSRPASEREGAPLRPGRRQEMESLLGDDFGDVRIHTGPAAAEAARELRADAFAVERDVFFATGKDTFDSPEGAALLSHELTHVRQGRRVGRRHGAEGSLQATADEREAASTEWSVYRALSAGGPARPTWERPSMDLPDLGTSTGAVGQSRGRLPAMGGGVPATGSGPQGIARAPADRTTEQAPTPTAVAPADSEASAREERETLDLDAVATQVYELIMRRLTLERERIGFR